MTTIDDVRHDRDDLARVLKKHPGIRRLVEDLYPDRAHFIYELLQNAEDTGASEVRFTLRDESLEFEHNGRPFDIKDIYLITDIGKAVEAVDEEKIGRFGVGFKAVFAYTEEPCVWSPTFNFKITDLVLPWELEGRDDLGSKTRFAFPFNNPKKPRAQAYAEVETGLMGLAETTLLFLTNLRAIHWEIDQRTSGAVVRIEHAGESQFGKPSPGRHIEVRTESDGTMVASSHFLRYDQPVKGLDRRWIAVAFQLAFLPDVRAFEPNRPLNEQMKIVPALQGQAPSGRVAIFFPAEKEQSGLCFHLHAPFVPELSRASVKSTDANHPLFSQLAGLAASVLHDIRVRGLLTGDFLAVLPNQLDSLPRSYQPIRDAIVQEMKNGPLTPTHAGGHAPAACLLQARAPLKELLSEEDLDFLVPHQGERPKWAIGATQKNSRVDRFLSALEIPEWGTEGFVDVLAERASEAQRFVPSPPRFVREPDEEFMRWFEGKPPEWHQDLYALLFSDYLESAGWRRTQLAERLKPLRIVRLNNGTYSVARKCFFPSDSAQGDEVLPRVDPTVYMSGRSKAQQDNAKRLLEEIGVREVGLAELVEKILEVRYSANSLRPDKEHLSFFVSLVEEEPHRASLFSSHLIFKRDDGRYGKPSQVFLDVPFLDTGLRAYYDGLGDTASRRALSDEYLQCGVTLERLAAFARAVGAQTALEVRAAHCQSNAQWEMLASGQIRKPSNDTYKRINSDYDIPELARLAALRSEAASRLIWSTMVNVVQPDQLIACYRHNNKSPMHSGPSQLVHRLITACWVPQSDGRFVCPADAVRDQLPKDFAFDADWPWIQAIRFGSNAPRESEEQLRKRAIAEELGFADGESLELGKWFASLPAEARDQIRADWDHRRTAQLPDRQPRDPEVRSKRIRAKAANAPKRLTEERSRSVSVGLEEVKQAAGTYLRDQYTTDGEMICQVCKTLLPFKLHDGSDYFEKVEFLDELERHHYQNYLALCPNHAAMFQYANGSRDCLAEMFSEMTGNELPIKLAEKDVTIYFTTLHRDDLKAVIEEDRKQSRGDGDTA